MMNEDRFLNMVHPVRHLDRKCSLMMRKNVKDPSRLFQHILSDPESVC